MKRFWGKGLCVATVFAFLFSFEAFALTDTQQFTVYCQGNAVYLQAAEVEVGQASLFEIKENSGNTAEYTYVWQENPQGDVVIEKADEDDSSKVLVTAASSFSGTGKTVEIEVRITGPDGFAGSVKVPVKISDYRADVGLYNKNRPDVELKDAKNPQYDLTAEAYKVEYRVFQAIYNLKSEYSFMLNTLPSSVTYIFDGSSLQPVETEDFAKTVNFKASIDSPDRSVRNGLVSAAASFGVTSFNFQNEDYYVLDMSDAGQYPGEAKVRVDFDLLYQTSGRKIASKIAQGTMKLYIYDPQARTLKEGPELKLMESDPGVTELVTEKGEMFILTEKISLIGSGGSSSEMESGSEGHEPVPNTSGPGFWPVPAGLTALFSVLLFKKERSGK